MLIFVPVVSHFKTLMYFEQLWADFLYFQGMQGVYFELPFNEESVLLFLNAIQNLKPKQKPHFVSMSTGLQAKGS